MSTMSRSSAFRTAVERAPLSIAAHGWSTSGRGSPRIAIIGGGISGLSLLATLSRFAIPATLYERDTSARTGMGGMLDLHFHSGQRCLRENGLEDAARRFLRPEGEETRIYRGNSDGELLHHEVEPAADPEFSKPEIDRGDLIRLLLNACRPDAVEWGRGLKSVRSLGPSGPTELLFSDGSKTECDLLIGADGAFSRVRPLLSDVRPDYSGANGFELLLPASVTASPQHTELVEKIGQGSAFFLADGKMLAGQRNGSGRIRVYAWTNLPERWRPPSDPGEILHFLRDLFVGWQPWMLQLFDLCDTTAIYPRPLYQLPVGFSWAHRPSITLVGDAAHLMTPFAGVGANLAMLDGLELGIAIATAVREGRGPDALDEAIGHFEREMLRRATDNAQMAVDNQQRMLSFDNADAMMEKMAAFQRDRVQKV